MKLHIVDVFAERRYAGNQLAVIEDAAALSGEQMQTLAREMNFSETTFVTARGPGRAAVRIFTPGQELPFAGHPTLGTAWVLCDGAGEIVLELGAGDVPVHFEDGVGWFEPPPAEFGAALETGFAATLIGLQPEDLDPEFLPRFIHCGPRFRLIGVRALDELRRIAVPAEFVPALMDEGNPFVFCRGGYSADADFAARMLFFDGTALREDPATGSANSAFAAYLRERGDLGEFVVEQGFEIRRDSRLRLQVGERNAIGGRVQPVAVGELL